VNCKKMLVIPSGSEPHWQGNYVMKPICGTAPLAGYISSFGCLSKVPASAPSIRTTGYCQGRLGIEITPAEPPAWTQQSTIAQGLFDGNYNARIGMDRIESDPVRPTMLLPQAFFFVFRAVPWLLQPTDDRLLHPVPGINIRYCQGCGS
jgi:hypothetical protein